MTQNSEDTGGLYRSRININDESDVWEWAVRLKVTPEKLKDAIARAGAWSDDVQFALNADQPPYSGTAKR